MTTTHPASPAARHHSSRRPHALDATYEFLSLSWIAPHVVLVALNRPRKRNAMNRALWKEIGRAFGTLGSLGDGCRCILLAGNGSVFSAGIDLSDPSFLPPSSDDSDDADDVVHVGLAFQPKLKDMQDCFTALEQCPVPVVAAVHGRCIGAGMDLISAADIRICTSDTIFSVREVALGLAADVGTLQRLPKIVGNQSFVRDVCLTGRNFTAAEALQQGLVSQSVALANQSALLESATRLCCEIARHSPVAVRGTKRALLYARDHSVPDGLDQIASYNTLALQGQDLATAFGAGRATPIFEEIPKHSRL